MEKRWFRVYYRVPVYVEVEAVDATEAINLANVKECGAASKVLAYADPLQDCALERVEPLEPGCSDAERYPEE